MAKAFLVQYKYMTDSALDRISLQNMKKKTTKTFREYAYKWRDLAAQVQLSMIDKELNKMFLNNDWQWSNDRNSNNNFSSVVFVGKMIENMVKLSKIESIEAKKSIFKKKEGETHVVSY